MNTTTLKIQQFIIFVQKKLRREKRASLTALAKERSMPSEYLRWMVEDGFIKCTLGGKRGRKQYVATEKSPTREDALIMQLKYNKLRNPDGKSEYLVKHTPLLSLMYEISETLKRIESNMKNKNGK